jgi:hypothetical protein
MYKFNQEDYVDLYNTRKAINCTQSGAATPAKCPFSLEGRSESLYDSNTFIVLLFPAPSLPEITTYVFVFVNGSSFECFYLLIHTATRSNHRIPAHNIISPYERPVYSTS